MSKPGNVAIKLSTLLASCALIVGVASSAPICFLLFHQPRVPQGMRKYSKSE